MRFPLRYISIYISKFLYSFLNKDRNNFPRSQDSFLGSTSNQVEVELPNFQPFQQSNSNLQAKDKCSLNFMGARLFSNLTHKHPRHYTCSKCSLNVAHTASLVLDFNLECAHNN